MLLWASSPSRAEEQGTAPAPGMTDYVTCAVYYRMVVGSMSPRHGRDLGPLADIARDKMSTAIELARSSAAGEFGKEHAEEKFQSAWRATLNDMTDQINRNYDNITLLRSRYGNRCEQLIKGASRD